MRYTRIALSVFGLGLVLGFVIVVGEFDRLGRVASTLMAVGLVLLPAAVMADRGRALRAWFAARLPRRKRKTPRRKSRSVAGPRRKPPSRPAARPARRGRSRPPVRP